MTLTLLAPLLLAQTFSVDRVTTTPGIKEAVARAMIERALPELEKCKSEYPLFAGEETDDRILITFTTPAEADRVVVRGEIDRECVEQLVASWRFPARDVRFDVWLRAKFDFAQSRRQIEVIDGHLKFTCAAFIKRLGKKAPSDNAAVFDATQATQVDLRKRVFPDGQVPERRAPYVSSLVQCSPADFGVLLHSAFEELHLAPDESCKKVIGWFRNLR